MAFLILISVVALLVYLLNNYLFSYWSKRGFKQLQPKFFVGDAGPLLTLKQSMGEYYQELYKKYKSYKVLGIYTFYRPILIVTDSKLVQDIFIRDFTSFHDRPMPVDEKRDPLTAHLFNVPGQIWRDLRVKLSPTFTSGKLKGMFPIIRDVASVLDQFLVKNVKQGTDVFEFRDLMARFTTNIISSVAFGIDNDCINEPDHIFRKIGAKIFEPSLANAFRGTMAFLLPNHLHKLGLKLADAEVEKFIIDMVDQTIEYREKNNYSRNDFMQLLIQLKDQGYVSVDKGDKEAEDLKAENGAKNMNKLSMTLLYANTFVFFAAGFETSSSTMSFCLYELSKQKEIQKKIQKEIDEVLKKHNGEITYDVLSELKYLEACVDETLRKYPIVPVHFRTATKDYTFAGTDLTVEKGTGVMIPVLGFHRDPEIYDEPMKFKPERFLNSPTGGGNAEGVFYTPFGDGPRNCIGMRMGKVTTKIGLATVMAKYNLELTDREMINGELEFHPNQLILTPLKNFNIRITPR